MWVGGVGTPWPKGGWDIGPIWFDAPGWAGGSVTLAGGSSFLNCDRSVVPLSCPALSCS